MNLPVTRDALSTPFFDAASRGQLLIRRSVDGTYLHPSAAIDPADPSQEPEWVPASGDGILLSWLFGPTDADGNSTPVGGLIALAEGPQLLAPVHAQAEDLFMGCRMTAIYPPAKHGETIPVFVVSSPQESETP